MAQTVITIQGMHCDGCAQRLKMVLERQNGVDAADVSLNGQEALVAYDDAAVTPEQLKLAIEGAGYTARIAAGSNR